MKALFRKVWFGLVLFGCFAASPAAKALSIFTLDSSLATLVTSANTTSPFYEVTGAGAESGTAAGLFSATLGGSENSGWWIEITWGSNPQPILNSAFIKAANDYLWWDSFDLAAFNAGAFDGIRLVQDGIANHNGKFNEISHAGLNGSEGTTRVPDGGSTVMLLGFGLMVLSAVRCRRQR